jgi:vitamin B12 transporter
MIQSPIDSNTIVVTAARAPETAAETAASVVVIDQQRIERFGEPLIAALLRLTPSAAVAVSGPAGSLTEVRIRGAEANHTLLFIDGIRANDPASGNAPRFELLNADLASRIEVVRGPQSALWGSEAIGGVVAVDGADTVRGVTAAAETGSFGFRRARASTGLTSGPANLALAVGWQRARGIDSFNGEGDRDGYRNLSGRLRGTWTLGPAVELGVAAIALTGMSAFDGFDPVTFLHADTLDSSRNRLFAGRLSSRLGTDSGAWRGEVAASWLGSSNRNLLAGDALNRTRGRRATLSAQVEHGFTTGPIAHRLIAAAEHEQERFRARDTVYGGFTNQDRTRQHDALTVEWRGEGDPLVGDVAVRHDRFNRFKDATTLRASLLARIGGGWSLTASYGEGIAQPTFFDLYGFFPGLFVGNPALKPERSRGGETSVRYRGRRLSGTLTWYRQRLTDEIIDTPDFSSTVNRAGRSRRSGVEAELAMLLAQDLRLTANYAFLDASEPAASPVGRLRESRRPRHSGSIALDGKRDRLTFGASLAYAGARRDTDFDVFPAQPVRLGAYWLAEARLAYAVTDRVALFARTANAFDANYQDVFGYRTEGRSIYAGIRFAAGR